MTWATPNYRMAGKVPPDVWNEEVIDNIDDLRTRAASVASTWGLSAPPSPVSSHVELDDIVTSVGWNEVVTDLLMLRDVNLKMGDPTLPDPPVPRGSGTVSSTVYNEEIIDNLLALDTATGTLEGLSGPPGFTFVGASFSDSNLSSGNSLTVNAPTRQSGDLLVYVWFVKADQAESWTLTSPTGSDLSTGAETVAPYAHGYSWQRTATNTSADNWSITAGSGIGTGRAACFIAAFRSHPPTVGAGSAAIAHVSTGTPVTASVPPTTIGRPGVTIGVTVGARGALSGTPSVTVPTGFTGLGTQLTSDVGSWTYCARAYYKVGPADAYSAPVARTSNGTDMWSFAINFTLTY